MDEAGQRVAGSAAQAAVVPALSACAGLAAAADERCRLADAAREELRSVTERLVAAREERDVRSRARSEAEAGAGQADHRAARDRAQAAFQAAREKARTTDEIAGAASTWLIDINRINDTAFAAGGRLERERAGSEIATAMLEHLVAEAEAARLAAGAADESCRQARREAEDCVEAVRLAEQTRAAAARAAVTTHREAQTEEASPPPVRLGKGRTVIGRILAGDLALLADIAGQLSGDPDGRRRWEARLTELLEAILLGAVDAGAIALPVDHPFWGLFTPGQAREILSALSALGYRFDGLGGWAQGRLPTQRDLSLAVAHAGLEPMRIRRWPTPVETEELVRDAVVLGAEHLEGVAPNLGPHELTSMLGHEARGLADVWLAWERIRPLLLAAGPDGDPGPAAAGSSG